MGQSINPEWRHKEAGVSLGLADVVILTERWAGYVDIQKISTSHYLQLSLTPMGNDAIGSFPDHWGPKRFEPMGRLFLLPAGQLVRARGECPLQRSIRCRFNTDAVARWFDRELDWTDRRLSSALNIGSQPVHKLLGRVVTELLTPGFASKAILELMIAEIGIELSRYFMKIEERDVSGGLAPWRLRLIDDYLTVSAGTATLSELASLCNISVRHLTRAFRASRGQSLGGYIADCRFDAARRLLDEGASVKEVALASGFTATTNFTTAFRRVTGKTPHQYLHRAPVE